MSKKPTTTKLDVKSDEEDSAPSPKEESSPTPPVTTLDLTADIIDPPSYNGTLQDEEFPMGFVWFAPNIRWWGSYVVRGEITPTGRGYEIQRTGTKVDIRDMETLKDLREMVFCRIKDDYIEVRPLGVTRV